MKYAMPVFALAMALTVSIAAQDSTVTSRSKIKADDARIVSMTGCLREDPITHSFTLTGTMAAAGDELKSKSKVKTDVDKDETKTRSTSSTKAGDGAVATTGAVTTYSLRPADDVLLSEQVGHQVQVSAMMVEPGHGDADIKIKDKTKVDPEHGDDATTRSKTKLELPRSAQGQYTVVSVRPLGNCSTY